MSKYNYGDLSVRINTVLTSSIDDLFEEYLRFDVKSNEYVLKDEYAEQLINGTITIDTIIDEIKSNITVKIGVVLV